MSARHQDTVTRQRQLLLHDQRRHATVKWLKLGGLAGLGLCAVSIPLTVAIVMSTTGASDLLTIGDISPKHPHATPARAVAGTRCNATRGYYALTFEDGPLPGSTPGLVRALEQAKAVATFFDVGERAAGRESLVELQHSVGQVANETYSRPHMARVSQARRYQEMQMAARVLDYPNAFFRPPFGETSPAVDADARRSRLQPVYWTVDTGDSSASTKQIVALALRVKPGGIIRLHDGVARTIAAVPAIVAGLRDRGMCPGFLATAAQAVRGANGVEFDVVAVKP